MKAEDFDKELNTFLKNKDSEKTYKSEIICMIANIPDNAADNDPTLRERMQFTYDNYFTEYKAIIAGKTSLERIKGGSCIVPEISCMESDYIDEQVNKLTRVTLMEFGTRDRIKIRRYLAFLNEKKSTNETGNYVLKNESVIVKLFEKYGDSFPDEKRELWKRRWIDGSESLPPITKNEFKEGNNKHLILTMLYEFFPYLKVTNKESYIKKRWGLKSYPSDVSKYLTGKDARSPHHEKKNIIDILKPETL